MRKNQIGDYDKLRYPFMKKAIKSNTGTLFCPVCGASMCYSQISDYASTASTNLFNVKCDKCNAVTAFYFVTISHDILTQINDVRVNEQEKGIYENNN